MKELENFYVIPGNEMEFQDYAHNHTSRLAKIGMVPRIVLLEYDLSSDVNPSGVFIGTWKDREDIMGIFANLNNMTLDKLKLARLQEIWRLVVKHKEKQ